MTVWQKMLAGLAGIVVFGVVAGFAYWKLCYKLVDNTEVGYVFNKWDGTLTVIDRTGYVQVWPFIHEVHTIDMRPMQLCLNANQRVLNCKLAQFNKQGLLLFVQWHGRKDYEIRPIDDSGRGSEFMEIMKSYAFEPEGTQYPFLSIIPKGARPAGLVEASK